MTPEQWRAAYPEAAAALRAMVIDTGGDGPPGSETAVQSDIRLEAARMGIKLYRNNVGVLKDTRGTPVRFGLANSTRQENEVFKSSDLIGWRPVVITEEMIGSMVARFVSIECKEPQWKWSGNKHETAQANWINLVNAGGGEAYFSTGAVKP